MRSRFFFTIGIGLLLAACTQTPDVVFESPSHSSVSSSSAAAVLSSQAAQSSAMQEEEHEEHPEGELPDSVLIKMTFVAQAPHANWDMPYQEACEETSLIVVKHYLDGTPLSADIADAEIKAMVAWQIDTFGSYEDTTAAQVQQIAEEHLGRSARVIYDPSIEDIKEELAKGNPVIVPAAGRDLGNPYFSGEGPWYHMLVIVGYDDDEFITHDVGTRRGENYRYDQEVLFDAIHDWTGVKEEIRTGRRAMVIME